MSANTTAINAPDPKVVAARLLDRSGSEEPPLNLDLIIARCNGLRVIEENIDGDGYYIPLGSSAAEILVKASSVETRKRFTIAHELGHWALARFMEADRGAEFQPERVGSWLLEEWCNTFAASLLIPEHWLKRYAGESHGVELARLLAIGHQRFKVSSHAFRRAAASVLRVDIHDYCIDGGVLSDENYYLSRCTKGLAERVVRESLIHETAPSSPELSKVLRIGSVECSISGFRSRTKVGCCGLVLWTTRTKQTDC